MFSVRGRTNWMHYLLFIDVLHSSWIVSMTTMKQFQIGFWIPLFWYYVNHNQIHYVYSQNMNRIQMTHSCCCVIVLSGHLHLSVRSTKTISKQPFRTINSTQMVTHTLSHLNHRIVSTEGFLKSIWRCIALCELWIWGFEQFFSDIRRTWVWLSVRVIGVCLRLCGFLPFI